MAKLLMFANGDGPTSDVDTKLAQEGNHIQLSAKVSGSHKVKWEGAAAPAGSSSSSTDPAPTTFKVLMPDGKLVTVEQVVTLSRVVPHGERNANVEVMSLTNQQFGAALQDGVDFRNIKSKRIEKESQVYGRVNTKSAAKPQRLGDSETKAKVQDRRRKRDEEVGRVIDGKNEGAAQDDDPFAAAAATAATEDGSSSARKSGGGGGGGNSAKKDKKKKQ